MATFAGMKHSPSMNKSQHRYMFFQGSVVIVLALVRCWMPSSSAPSTQASADSSKVDTVLLHEALSALQPHIRKAADTTVVGEDKVETPLVHRVVGVRSYREEFPDTNDLQLAAARRWGVPPVDDRHEAESRKMELVYMAASPYYRVEKLNSSIPYLVPRAAILLHDIGQAYYDSLQIKGLPLHQLLVTSVLRTTDDVQRLRRSNRNATENSCHLYGTTFDIAYNKYEPLRVNGELVRREVRSDTLKWVLSEVLRDMRQQGRCYIKYEVKQGCFHITTR